MRLWGHCAAKCIEKMRVFKAICWIFSVTQEHIEQIGMCPSNIFGMSPGAIIEKILCAGQLHGAPHRGGGGRDGDPRSPLKGV